MTSPAWRRHRAVRALAHHARDAAELATLLDMLDLTAEEGLRPAKDPPVPAPRTPPVRLDAASACRLDNLMQDAHRRPS